MVPRGIYRQIADELRRSILDGQLQSGAMVPSELALVEQHEVARGTVRSAPAMLVDEGLIEVVPGQGRRVIGTARGNPATACGRIAAIFCHSSLLSLVVELGVAWRAARSR